MSLDKAINSKKERRKPYTGAKAIDHTCRNHGSCPYCEQSRTHFDTKNRTKADKDVKDFKTIKE
mgnify:CR=1 FL=1